MILLRRIGRDVLATINSDDPGTFGPRIENEFAFVFSALRSRGMPRAEALAVIERMRDVGLQIAKL